MKTLKVLLTDKEIGEVTQRANCAYRFEYLTEWQRDPPRAQRNHSPALGSAGR
jgi:HipA-like protein